MVTGKLFKDETLAWDFVEFWKHVLSRLLKFAIWAHGYRRNASFCFSCFSLCIKSGARCTTVLYENAFCLHANENVFSYKKMCNRPRLTKVAKGEFGNCFSDLKCSWLVDHFSCNWLFSCDYVHFSVSSPLLVSKGASWLFDFAWSRAVFSSVRLSDSYLLCFRAICSTMTCSHSFSRASR